MIEEKQLSSEQRKLDEALQAEGEQEFASKLVASMDLPSTLADAVDESEKKADEEPVEEETEEQEESGGEEESEKKEEVLEESDEDLIPKSKVQKRFDEMTREIKALKKQVTEQSKVKEQEVVQDQQLKQLESMSESDLRTLKRQVRVEQIKSSTDETKLSQLLDLEEKIDQTIRTSPIRFNSNQVSNFNKAVEDSAGEIENFDTVKAEIFNHAKNIFTSSPELQNSVMGQARAWNFAIDHYKALNKISEGKSNDMELKRKMNTLKKKISIDSTSKKAVQAPDSQAKLFKKAVYGNEQDKKNFIRSKIDIDALMSE